MEQCGDEVVVAELLPSPYLIQFGFECDRQFAFDKWSRLFFHLCQDISSKYCYARANYTPSLVHLQIVGIAPQIRLGRFLQYEDVL